MIDSTIVIGILLQYVAVSVEMIDDPTSNVTDNVSLISFRGDLLHLITYKTKHQFIMIHPILRLL